MLTAAQAANLDGRRTTVALAVYTVLREHRVRAKDACALLRISTGTKHARQVTHGPEVDAARRVASGLLPRPPSRSSLLEVAKAVLEGAARGEGVTVEEAATRNTRAAIRARVEAVRVLRSRHRLRFEEIAECLGFTRSTCSHLARGARGKVDRRKAANRVALTADAATC